MKPSKLLQRLANLVFHRLGAQLLPYPPHLDRKKLNRRLRNFYEEQRNAPRPEREAVLVPEILLPAYNHGRYLAEAIRSATKHGVPLTVINDASTDDTSAILDELAKRYEFKRIDNPVNLKQWGSLNKAIEESEANLFIVLNADDMLLPWAIPTILALWQAYPQIRMLGGGHVTFRRAATTTEAFPEAFARLPSPEIYLPERVATFSHPNDLNMTMPSHSFVRSAWQAAGKFKPLEKRLLRFDDRDFQLRVALMFPVAVIDEPLAFYRVGSSTWTG